MTPGKPKPWRAGPKSSLQELGLPKPLAFLLKEHGLSDPAALAKLSERGIRTIPGIGPGKAAAIRAALKTLGLDLAEDLYGAYQCARDGNKADDVSLTSLWLCDTCAAGFQKEVFDGKAPEWQGAPVDGYCVNCVIEKSDVRLRQWFLCGNCGRVAQSFGRSVVAARDLMKVWKADFEPRLGIALDEVDPPKLYRRVKGAPKVSAIDFIGRHIDSTEHLFGIEMKTGQAGIGRGAVRQMSEFQLDCSDCDDIATVAEKIGLPVFLVHAQVVERATPPTRRFEGIGYWWTDPYTMSERCDRVANRAREVRPAAYYPVGMFRPLVEFAAYLESGELKTLRKRIAQEGRFPALYPAQPRKK